MLDPETNRYHKIEAIPAEIEKWFSDKKLSTSSNNSSNSSKIIVLCFAKLFVCLGNFSTSDCSETNKLSGSYSTSLAGFVYFSKKNLSDTNVFSSKSVSSWNEVGGLGFLIHIFKLDTTLQILLSINQSRDVLWNIPTINNDCDKT
ncbi:MAG: hypothetical protein AAGJ08_04465 [Cyanobacteria bacterium P01_H01_bin.35]